MENLQDLVLENGNAAACIRFHTSVRQFMGFCPIIAGLWLKHLSIRLELCWVQSQIFQYSVGKKYYTKNKLSYALHSLYIASYLTATEMGVIL